MGDNKALTVLSTDWHIKLDNTEQIIDLVNQKIALAKKLKVKNLICLGDVFQSRQAQPLIVFKCFEKILGNIHEANMTLYTIPGNHDKTNYSSSDSFLDQFQWHPAFELMVGDQIFLEIGNWNFWFLPFYEEERWKLELHGIIEDYVGEKISGKDILLSHQALTGSVNNNGSKVENSIHPEGLGVFYKVFLGHYHNKQQIGKNVFHLPSIKSNDFGEDNDKGFTIFHEDGDHIIVNSTFQEYHTVEIDLDNLSKSELNDLKKDGAKLIKESNANIRFKFKGDESKVKAIDKSEFEALGIDVKKEHKTIVKSIEIAESGEVLVYNDKVIIDKFDKFCKEENFGDIDYGRDCLTKKLGLNGE